MPLARVGQIEPLEIVWRPYELRPEGAPPPPAEYIERAWQQSVGPLSKQLGITMNQPSTNPSTRLTHEAVAYAVQAQAQEIGNRGGGGNDDDRDVSNAFTMAVFKAYWEDDRDIGDIDILCELAADVGLDRSGMRADLKARKFAPYVEEQIQLAKTTYQVSAVPTLIIANKFRIRGLPMEQQLLETIRQAKAK